MAGGGGFLGPRGRMGGGGFAGGSGGGGSFKTMRLGVKKVAVGGGGGVANTNSPTSPASKPRSRCTSPTRTHYQKSLTSSASTENNGNKGGLSAGYGLESPFSPYYGWVSDFAGEDYEWVSYDGRSDEEEEEVCDVSEEKVLQPPLPQDEGFLGPVPSPEEVHSAVSALTQVFGTSSHSQQLVRDKYEFSADAADPISSPVRVLQRVASVGSESDWLEPSPNLCNTRMTQSLGSDRVYDAFHLLQTDPSVQRMVISLSSDRAVWDAVLNNEAVRELRQTYNADVNTPPPSLNGSDESAGKTNPALKVIMWMLDSTRSKFADIFETLSKIVNDLLKKPEEAEIATDPPETEPERDDRIMISFGITIVVFMIVAVGRDLWRARP